MLSLVAFGSTLGSLWLAQTRLGAFGPPPDRHLVPMWVPLALPWAPLAILELPGRFGLNLESIFKVNVAQVPCLRTKYGLRELVKGVAEVVQNGGSDPTSHARRAPG